ncbi:hypothetical protein H6F90_24020 [Trichocoleus sp. FACHB-591]|uniref:hypothetical protein n=1 Tax=Trichocoleus sp. FACHB-591 TaxID=2692872 RepID=UPI0016826256|nr:hypothetical protein [Trichocoleus sp. FACHB-591]MBD2098143.1 hypothetical protein [Trichocoleus sp. FACHB-591]
MSSASSGRYQSRLFNFFSRQSRELVDQCDRAFRHAKVATVWGAQILLYPIYAMFQATRLVGKQIQTSVETERPSLDAAQAVASDASSEPPSANQVVCNVLQVVETFALPEVVVPPIAANGSLAVSRGQAVVRSSQSSAAATLGATKTSVALGQQSAIAIQGVATALETRTLVLVTCQNQILNILTLEQQQQLYQRIVWEVSHYQRYLQILVRQRSRSPLPLPSDDSKVLPPVQLVRQMMAWVQTGPVAIALNWFQESTAVAQPIHLEEPYFSSSATFTAGILPIPPIPYEALAPLDQAIAQLEAHSLPPVLTLTDALVQRGQGLLSTVRAKLVSLPTFNRSTADPEMAPQVAGAPMPLQSLLRAAVDYFFGDRHLGLSGTGNPSHPTQMAGDQANRDRLLTGDYDWHPDPWLSYEDVFGQTSSATRDRPPAAPNALSEALPEQAIVSPAPLSPALQVPMTTAKNLWARLINRFWHRDARADGGAIVTTLGSSQDLVPQSAQTTAVTPLQNRGFGATYSTPTSAGLPHVGSGTTATRDQLTASNLAMSGAELAARSEDYGELSNTWIEAEATTLGYVKHPLERILGWLDRAMLWLEEVMLLAGQWLQQLWRK